MKKQDINYIQKLAEFKAHGVDSEYSESLNDETYLWVDFDGGCFVEDLIVLAAARLHEYQKDMPCRENAVALTKLEEAIHWLESRKISRETRGVLGTRES